MAKKIAKEIGTVVLAENDVQWKGKHKNVVAATDPDDSFSQTWEVEYDRIIYRVTVEEKEAEIMLV